MTENLERTPTCRWCGYKLFEGSGVCQKCDRDQNHFLERSKQLVTLAAAIGVLVSAMNYVWPSVYSIAVSSTAPVLKVRSLRTETQESLIVNAGKRSIIVSHFQAVSMKGTPTQIDLTSVLNQTMKPGEAFKPDLRSLTSKRIERSNEMKDFKIQGSGTKEDRTALLKLMLHAPPEERQGVKLQVMGEDQPLAESILSQPSNPGNPDVGPLVLDFECCFVFSAVGDSSDHSVEVPCMGFFSTSFDAQEFWQILEKYR